MFASEKDLSLIAKSKKKIDDLEAILPEILEKVQEAQALKKEREAMKNTLKSTLKSAFGLGMYKRSAPGSGLFCGKFGFSGPIFCGPGNHIFYKQSREAVVAILLNIGGIATSKSCLTNIFRS